MLKLLWQHCPNQHAALLNLKMRLTINRMPTPFNNNNNKQQWPEIEINKNEIEATLKQFVKMNGFYMIGSVEKVQPYKRLFETKKYIASMMDYNFAKNFINKMPNSFLDQFIDRYNTEGIMIHL